MLRGKTCIMLLSRTCELIAPPVGRFFSPPHGVSFSLSLRPRVKDVYRGLQERNHRVTIELHRYPEYSRSYLLLINSVLQNSEASFD